METFIIITIIIAIVVIAIVANRNSANKNRTTKSNNPTLTTKSPKSNMKTKIDDYHLKTGLTVDMEIARTQNFEIKGTFVGARKDVCLRTYKNEELKIVTEPTNEHDKNALLLCNFNNEVLGYIPASSAGRISRLLESGIVFRAFYSNNTEGKYFRARVNVTEYTKKKAIKQFQKKTNETLATEPPLIKLKRERKNLQVNLTKARKRNATHLIVEYEEKLEENTKQINLLPREKPKLKKRVLTDEALDVQLKRQRKSLQTNLSKARKRNSTNLILEYEELLKENTNQLNSLKNK